MCRFFRSRWARWASFCVLSFVGAVGTETVHRALILAIVARLVAIEQFVGARLVAHGAEGERGVADGADFGGVAVQLFKLVRSAASCRRVSMVIWFLFEAEEPESAPFGQGHGFDVAGLDRGDGLEFFLESVQDFGEALG